MYFDFTTFDDQGRRRFLVEAKLRHGVNASWAAATRRNWLSYGEIPAADGLIVVVPDHVFVWLGVAAEQAPPTYDIDARPLLAPYFAKLGVSSHQIGPSTFEQLVRWWLDDLTQQSPLAWTDELRHSGLVEALAGQDIVTEQAA